MKWLIELLGWLLRLPPRRTTEDVLREIITGLEDGTIVIPGEGAER